MSELTEVKLDIKKVTFVTTFLTATIIVFLLWSNKISWEISNNIITHLTIIIGIINVFFWLFIKEVWKWTIIPKSMRLYLNIPPNLNGRWEGYCICKGDSVVNFTVKIKQDYLNLKYQIFTKNDGGASKGSEVITATIFNNTIGNYSVVTTWRDGGSFKENADLVNSQKKYEGTSKWDIFSDRNNITNEIRWFYYTSRKTEGNVRIKFASKDLFGKPAIWNMENIVYPLKININIELSNEVNNFCMGINQHVVNEGFNEINFQGNQQHLPHITLLMGEIKTMDDYLDLLYICNLFSQKHKAINYEVSMPYWKKPSEKFVFVDVLPLEKFTKLRLELYEDVKELIKCSAYGGPNSETHITVGYADSPDAEYLDLNIINSSSYNLLGVASSIRICRAGVHGTCSEILNQFYLK